MNVPSFPQPSRVPSPEEELLYSAARRQRFCATASRGQGPGQSGEGPPNNADSETALRALMAADCAVLRKRERTDRLTEGQVAISARSARRNHHKQPASSPPPAQTGGLSYG
jgi:hypothetical protein